MGGINAMNKSIESSNEEIKQPYWNRIVSECKLKIREKYPEYGNSWADGFQNGEFWQKRLQGEVNELKELLHGSFHDEVKVMKECLDVINICSMIYSIEAERYHDWVYGGRHG